MASISKSTIKQYGSELKKWKVFCERNNREFFDIDSTTVLIFLSELFNLGASYGTLNSCRSALALISKCDISLDKNITRFMKGIFKLRPLRPRYTNTWDVSIVLNYLKDIDTSSLVNLTEKTIMLLALSTAQRAQSLSKIKVTYINILKDSIEINIPDIIKTSAPGAYQPSLSLPFLDANKDLCVARTILLYLEGTKSVREKCEQLFISTKKPHHEVSTQTISRWVKQCLMNSGIDTNVFKAHSTRHAATSAASERGLDFDTIRRSAGWTEQSKSFARFYKRPIINDSHVFAKSVLEE